LYSFEKNKIKHAEDEINNRYILAKANYPVLGETNQLENGEDKN